MAEKIALASCNESNGLVYRVVNGDCRVENKDVISICMGSTSADIEGANNEMLKKFPIIAISEELGLPEEQSLKIGSFGSGMRKEEVCGDCTGALMVLGLKYDHSR